MKCEYDQFEACKGPGETVDLSIAYNEIFDDFSPVDQIANSVWAVTRGNVVVDSDRIEGVGNDVAVGRISGGTPYNSYHEVLNTVTTTSGQIFTRTIKLHIVKT